MEFWSISLQKWLILLIIVWSSMTIIPSSTQADIPVCWGTINDCQLAQTGYDLYTYAITPLCCPVFRQQIQDVECYCSITSYILSTTTDGTSSADVDATMNQMRRICSVYGTFEDVCHGTSTPTDSTPSNNCVPVTSKTKSNTSTIIIAVVVVIVVGIIIAAIIIICVCCRKPANANVQNSPHNANDGRPPVQSVPIDVPPVSSTPVVASVDQTTVLVFHKDDFKMAESLQYDLATIDAATNNFSNDNIIGRGGFGFVYKGTLSTGQEIAVKRLSHNSDQGDRQFKAEVELLAKLQHRNMVQLLGFCLADGEALLVYELVPNKSLDYFLFDNKKREELKWPIRFDIIRGIARGMLYLHEDSPLRTVHRDLKAGNVLLDAKMKPKIADFGLARICALEQTHVDATHVVGTRGYMSPEYLFYGQFSVKSDVYAFGVLVLEIISGRRVRSSSNRQSGERSQNLITYAWRCWEQENPLEFMDPMLKDSFTSDEVVKCMQIGLLCVQDDAETRPNMSTIVHMLNSYSTAAALPTPQYPGLLYNTGSTMTTTSTTTQSITGSTGGVSSSSAWSNFKNNR